MQIESNQYSEMVAELAAIKPINDLKSADSIPLQVTKLERHSKYHLRISGLGAKPIYVKVYVGNVALGSGDTLYSVFTHDGVEYDKVVGEPMSDIYLEANRLRDRITEWAVDKVMAKSFKSVEELIEELGNDSYEPTYTHEEVLRLLKQMKITTLDAGDLVEAMDNIDWSEFMDIAEDEIELSINYDNRIEIDANHASVSCYKTQELAEELMETLNYKNL